METVDLTPAAFDKANPNAQKNIAKANKAMDEQTEALKAKGQFASEMFNELMCGAKGKTVAERFANMLYEAAEKQGMDRDEKRELLEQYKEWGERWQSLEERHSKASE